MKYYVYRITDQTTRKYYIGYHSCKDTVEPIDDLGVNYFTSGSMKKTFKEFPMFFDREILKVFDTKESAYYYEQYLIKAYYKDPFCKNYFRDTTVKLTKKTEVKVPKAFTDTLSGLSRQKRKRAITREANKIAKRQDFEFVKQNFVEYCDLETRAIIKILP